MLIHDDCFCFKLAADAGNVIPMTEAEKKRLEELLSDETDLLMVEVTSITSLFEYPTKFCIVCQIICSETWCP